ASADDRLNALVHLSRALSLVSRDDAARVFYDAVEVAGELDTEVIRAFDLFAPLTISAAARMTGPSRRAIASRLATVVEDAGVRLSGFDYFPWQACCIALSTLDPAVAFGAASRWED